MTTKEKVELAIKNDELKELLLGQNPYQVKFDKFVGPVAPTDWTCIMPYVYEIARPSDLEKALLNLSKSNNAIELYIAVSVLYYYLNQKPTSFPVDTDQILRNLQNNLPLVKQDLINTKKWAGAQEKLGLYSEILRYNRLMQDKYNLSLFSTKEEN